MPHATFVRRTCLAAVVGALAACSTATPPNPNPNRSRDRVALSAELLDIADFGASHFQSAYIAYAVRDIPPRQLAGLGLIRNEAVGNMRAMALGDDPGRDLVDLYVWSRVARSACLHREEKLPDLAPPICAETYEVIGRRIDAMARRWIAADRLKRIDAAVDVFLASHPDLLTAALFRMVDLRERDEAGFGMDDLASDEGMFSPVSDAARQLEQTRITGQQMLWMLSRMPAAVGWEVQVQVALATSSSDVQAFRDEFARLQSNVGALSGSVQALDRGLGGETGMRGVMREALFTGGAVLAGLVALSTTGALLVVRAMRAPRRRS